MQKSSEGPRMESLLPSERRQRILELVRLGSAMRVSRLSELLGVSEMTIRRDLVAMEDENLIERTHGGAVSKQERMTAKFHYQKNLQVNLAEKQRIALRAAALIKPNDIVYLGEGTTVPLVVRYADPAMPFKVFTNNLGVIEEAREKSVELILLGGAYNPTTHSVAGSLTLEMIRQIYADKVFLGVDGLSLTSGLTTPDLEIAVIERSMIRHTRGQVIVMAHHDRFGLVAETVIAPLKRADVLITDRSLSAELLKDLESMRVNVLIADETG